MRARRFDGIDIADQVGDSHVGRGELFDEAIVRGEPRDGRVVAELRDQVAGVLADRRVRIVAHLGAGDVGAVRVKQRRQRAQDARLGLAAQSQQDEIVPRQNGVDDLRDDGIFVSDDAGKEWNRIRPGRCLCRVAESGDQVLAELVLDAAGKAGRGEFAGAESA